MRGVYKKGGFSLQVTSYVTQKDFFLTVVPVTQIRHSRSRRFYQHDI
ncbi:hypothetical protein CEV34_1514 [Brucella pseudogrignonensis]|uniref:Uncharacterized protein n=1 Tax=Brucella pseudogrignonensis TaxID=419475 RepID=A0A256GL78_9HYPH|nr:hypothetical protein CEV34_1514 [Brucella pseudogrignonensis]